MTTLFERSVSLENHVTLFQAEVYAIGTAARLMVEKGCSGEIVSIICDSEPAIKAMNNPQITSKVVLESVYYLNLLGEHNEVSLMKVPAHCGIRGNEAADILAKRGADPDFSEYSEVCIGISRSSAKSIYRKWLFRTWEQYWKSLPGLRHSKIFLGGITKDKSKRILKMSRKRTRLLTGFLTGHHPLRGRLKMMNITTDGSCRFCQEVEEKAHHLLCDCPEKARTRLRMIGHGFPTAEEYRDIDLERLYDYICELKV